MNYQGVLAITKIQLTRFNLPSKMMVKVVCLFIFSISLNTFSQIKLVKEFGELISPKSIVNNGCGLYAAQNMMYRHTVTFYNSEGDLVSVVKDQVNLESYGFKEYTGRYYKGGPVEACFSKDGKYLWVSNYTMTGKGFSNPGCDGCVGKNYDPGFLYKINTSNYKIENVIKVGSIPKFIEISDNGRLLIVSNWTSSNISIINLDTEKEIKRVEVGLRPRGIVIDSHNQFAYVAIMGSDKIAKVNLLNFKVTYIKGVGEAPRHLVLSQDNSYLYASVNSENKLLKINLRNGKKQFCKVNAGPRSMVISKDEKYLYVVNYYADSFQKIDAKTFQVKATVPTNHHPIGITGDWETNRLWVACYSGTIQIFKDHSQKTSRDQEVGTNGKKNVSSNGIQKKTTNLNQSLIKTSVQPCGYHLIVGSFSNVESASDLIKRFLKLGYTPTVMLSSNQDMTMVSILNFQNKKAASAAQKLLLDESKVNSWVYQYSCE